MQNEKMVNEAALGIDDLAHEIISTLAMDGSNGADVLKAARKIRLLAAEIARTTSQLGSQTVAAPTPLADLCREMLGADLMLCDCDEQDDCAGTCLRAQVENALVGK